MDELTQEFIAESHEGLERMERCLTELEVRPEDGALLSDIFRSVHTIKGTTGFLGFHRLEALAHAGEHLLGEVRDGKLAVSTELISGLLRLLDGLRAILGLIESRGTEGDRSSDEDGELIALLARLRSGDGENADGSSGAELIVPGVNLSGSEELVVPSREMVRPADGAESIAAGNGVSGGAGISEKTLRIDVEVLNRMMNLVGELVLTRNQILQSTPAAENFPELTRRLDSVTADLRESVMQARMQPVGHLFGKFPRMVRDLAQICGRAVRVEFEGQETGLDKSLLEAIKDPLTHAVRNSVDHGIEAPAERLKAGKPVEGLVRLRAYHQSGSVVIEVSDDGAGISRERILAKALERGLVTDEQAESMTEREVLQLVFVAGFSTAAAVTHVSGRGVGMDVVRSNVEKVGGRVALESKVGIGTTLRWRVPLTLAIIPALVVRSGGQSFALPQSSLVELVYVPRADAERAVERVGKAELYRLRGRMLPLVWLDRLLGLEQAEGVAVSMHGFYIAVLEAEGCRFGLVVDDLLSPEEIVVKPVSAVLREIGLFSGATVLGNGLLAMILDVAVTGARAGMRPEADCARGGEMEQANSGEGATLYAGTEKPLVIFKTGRVGDRRGREQTAMPLSSVERIESVALEEIEYAAGRPVLQYRGELLPLHDEDGVLEELGATAGDSEGEAPRATVLICLREGMRGMRRVGVVVRRVLDVSAGRPLALDRDVCDGPLAMVKDRVTTMHRGPVEAEPAIWQEVA